MKFAETRTLRVAYLEDGDAEGWPVILSHGFPYDVHAFDEVVPLLVRAGAHVIRPYCRGFGPTRFRFDDAMRTGQQAARALDILDLADGSDWSARSSAGSIGEETPLASRRHYGRIDFRGSFPTPVMT